MAGPVNSVPSDAPAEPSSSTSSEQEPHSLIVRSLTWAYPGCEPSVCNISLDLPRGSRCLLLGANGAGKSTLLQLLAGKHLVGRDAVRVLGRPAFYDLELTTSGELGYLGPQWRRDISFAGYDIPVQGDVGAGEMIFRVPDVDPERRQRLIDLLDIQLDWRLNKLSDGQRRRVQICMGLLKPYQVLLLDEITVDMDVVGRLDLLEFFRSECEERGAAIVYATHIFDGLEAWITHLAFVSGGTMEKCGTSEEVPELRGAKLYSTVLQWLRKERDEADAAAEAAKSGGSRAAAGDLAAPVRRAAVPAAFASSRHMAYYR